MENLQQRLTTIKQSLDYPGLQKKIVQIEKTATDPEFWQDHQQAGRQMQKLSDLQKVVEQIEALEAQIQDQEPAEDEREEIEQKLHKLELRTYLSGKYDDHDALLSIHAGQGGTEAMDWVSMLLRMYLKFFDSRGWQTEIIEETPGEEAGLKSVRLEVSGDYAYGYLQHEHGTHRLVRKSPFNADHLRQTSFALVEVVPVIETDVDLELDPNDLDIQTFRSSGPGGQHANKTESAVRVIHQPTGLTVKVSSSRSQLKNRRAALQLLRGKLFQQMREQKVEKLQELKGDYTPPTWGTQIRSYVLDPYQLVKDHRTELEIPQAENVLDGDLEELIEKEIRAINP